MHAKEQVLLLSLKLLAAYVEGIGNASPASAEAIVLSAGINLKRQPSAHANGFRLQAGSNPGEVQMRTDSDQRAVFTWEMTTTPADDASWLVISASTRAQFLATDLVAGTRYYFRVAKTGKDGQGPWSNVLDMIAA
ncbi:MAG: fibronectin type III domain-containing protein [Bacteroidia bacterium]